MLTPVWLLDVDGVINAISRKRPNIWPADKWRRDGRVAEVPFATLVAQPVLDFIADTHLSGRAEVRWHTTWTNHAQELGASLGLPRFEVADAESYLEMLGARAAGLYGGPWWKLAAAERVLREEKRPLLWTDDDITWNLGRRGADDMRLLGPALLIAPPDTHGLTPKNLRQIGEFLDVFPAEVSAA